MGTKPIHTEEAFENAIEQVLLHSGYQKGNPLDFNREFAIDTVKLLEFLRSSQPEKWERLQTIHKDEIETKLLLRLNKELDTKSALEIIRHGFTDMGVHFDLAYFKPETSFNPDTQRLYEQNILSVTRQVKYSSKNENSIDMVLFLNGMPIATVELKNQFTSQNTENAKKQYMYYRSPKETLLKFKRGALVHFAVDTDEVYLTTELKGNKTFFLPFNKGVDNGAGNPKNEDGYKTAYLWESIWQPDSILDIVGKFIHLEKEEYEQKGKKYFKEKLIFPRYHQLDVVRKLTRDTKDNGAGHNYLVQHSAGSGKSNSIAWLTYRLFSLHNTNDQKVFDSIIVITDRRVLDKQLQDTIYQFEHKQGVVQRIDKSSSQLAEAIKKGSSIIITTLQKFPFAAVLDEVKNLPDRNYAVVVDEAHSSQGGRATKKLKEVLTIQDEEEDTVEDNIRKSMQARGEQENLSFYGFTATPKPKTVEVFGTPDASGIPKPFHLYSMRQAIQEGFILDVLKNYMTYKTFFRVSKRIEENPNVNKKKAARAIARFLSLHPYNLTQKTEVIIEHFRQVVAHKIGGKAKAMVVTSSRLHAVRYYFEFKRYIKDNNYRHIKPLVAFSGKVKDPERPGEELTEVKLNGFSEKELPNRFNTDEYQILLVADKYQTGFDQPLLHTMYVDKKLSGVKAVQTLSRLNRKTAGKEDTFVLDFANDEQDIVDSFQPFYELTTVEDTSDPNRLYDLKNRIEEKRIIWQSEVDAFSKEYFTRKNLPDKKAHSLLNAYIDPAVDRFKAMESEEEQDDFKHTLNSFIKGYSFLSQIMPFSDAELEKLYAYGRLLLKKFPKNSSERFKLTDEVALQYYRLQKMKENDLALEHQEEFGLKPADEAGLRKDKDEEATLMEVIENINDRLGTEFTEADKLFFDQIGIDLAQNETIIKQAKNNSFEKFKKGSLRDLSIQQFIDRMDSNNDTTEKMLTDEKLADAVIFKYLAKIVYDRINS
ncbi:type I restriction endonuclease subunit R [Aureitalea sp. L0-47]|uniref:type I restriction endonuclease subunit R n=1 Tax=Aureitalea sp. L0-47 TaxID=2816962 RepID=UPI0022387AFC|nr:type I restriction endonuclease [Aureitalea sp. L0-47]MCW5518499.1 type I restriction endonuclease subunit R [Aureitalea sp. L0-47]